MTKNGIATAAVLSFSIFMGLPFVIGETAAARRVPTIQVVQTNPDQSKLLEPQAGLTFGPEAPLPVSIRVDDGIRYQQMDGYGASFTDSSAWLVWTKLTPAQRETVMRDLFGKSGISLSFLRQPMGATDLARSNYTYDDMPPGETDPQMRHFSIDHDREYIIPVLQKALSLNPKATVMAVPWSPPAWMKTNDSLNGGGFKTEFLPALARYFDRFLEAYEDEGIPVHYISVNNEPHYGGNNYPNEETSSYPTMFMTAAQGVSLIGNYLGPTLERHNRRADRHRGRRPHVPTQILGWDHNWDYQAWAETLLRNPKAAQYVAGTAFHCYAGNRVVAQRALQGFFPDKGLWFTECTGVVNFPVFGDNLGYNMRNLVIGAVREGAKSVVLWNMALDQNNGPFVSASGCKTCRGVITVDTSTTPSTVRYEVEYYSLGHASKFVTNGAHRIESNVAGPINNVAFRNPDGSLVLLAHNDSAADTTFSVEWRGETFAYTLPARAVATFKWNPDDDLEIAATPGQRTVPQGGRTSFDVAVERHFRSRRDIDIDVDAPAGITARVSDRHGCHWDDVWHGGSHGGRDDDDDDTLVVTLRVSDSVPVGTYPVTITARSRRREAASTVQVVVGPAEAPYPGAAWPIPGRVEIENFNVGGEGIAYHDFDPETRGGANIRPESVDIETTTDTGGGHNIGYTEAGEWLRYEVEVAAAGLYVLQARAAWPGAGGNFHVEIGGRNVTGTMRVPNTGGYQSWRTIQSRVFPLRAGRQTMRFVLDSGGGMGNFNWLQVTPVVPSTPFLGAPAGIPGTIEVENFDEGGSLVAYYDETNANQGGQYRTGGVDIENCTDVGGGFGVGFTGEGEWTNYTVNVAQAAAYTVHFRVASMAPGGTFYLAVNGAPVTGRITLPHTDGWQNWQTVTVPHVRLPAGVHTLQLIMDSRGYFGSIGNFNWMSFE